MAGIVRGDGEHESGQERAIEAFRARRRDEAREHADQQREAEDERGAYPVMRGFPGHAVSARPWAG